MNKAEDNIRKAGNLRKDEIKYFFPYVI